MTTCTMRELTKFAIGGGWGAEESDEDTQKVMVIRGADFPAAALQDLSSIPTRFEKSSKVSNRALSPGDIVLEISGGTKDRPTGRTVFITQKMVEDAASPLIPASFCRRLVIDSGKADPRFVYYWLQNMYATGQTWNYQNRSTGIANFQFEQFLDREKVYLPDRQMQLTISMLLGALDDKIAANSRIVKIATHLNINLVEKAVTKELEHLQNLADITMGSSPKGEFLNEEGIGEPFFQGVRDFGELFPSERVFAEKAVRTAQEGDILFAVRAPIGEVNIAERPCIIGRGIAAIRGKQSHLGLFYLLKGHPELWETYQSSGTVFAGINKSDLHNAVIPVLRDSEKLEQQLTPIHERAMHALRENQVLARTRDELLPLLMSGRITVGEAEDAADEAASES